MASDEHTYTALCHPDDVKVAVSDQDKGVYDHERAPKLWSYLVGRGARLHCQQFGGNVRDAFPKVIRDAVAQDYADEFIDDTDAAREHTV
jgi:hypothetical protein